MAACNRPIEAQLPEWRHDYESMSREMFVGDVPAFDEILRVVGEFEREFNRMAAAAPS